VKLSATEVFVVFGHPNAKSNIPIGREIKSLILNLFCGISGAMNTGPTISVVCDLFQNDTTNAENF
jgi:hypothetical protein